MKRLHHVNEDHCGQPAYDPKRPLTGSLRPPPCDRPRGHTGPHRHGPKVYCGARYRKAGDLYFCNLDLGHNGLHGWEPPRQDLPKRTMLDRLLDKVAQRWT